MQKEKERKRKKIHFNFFKRKRTTTFDNFIEQLKALKNYDFEYTLKNEDDTKIIKVKNNKK